MGILFVSDLHLDASRPEILQQFIEFNQRKTRGIEAYYILGDFLEYWVGDDDPAEDLQNALNSLSEVSARNIPVYLMHGNRDFLIGKIFAERYGLTLLTDPTVIELYGRRSLLMHGDLLCTADTRYQGFRRQVRDPAWQQTFLSKPLPERLAEVEKLRNMSKQAMLEKTDDIMDVSQSTVEQYMQDYHCTQLIHGHTHRPAIHEFTLNDQTVRRVVLGDWYAYVRYCYVGMNFLEFC